MIFNLIDFFPELIIDQIRLLIFKKSGPLQSHLQLCKEYANVKNKISIYLSQNENYCSGCKSIKDKNNFSSNQDWCKECKSNLMKGYYEKNKNNHRVTQSGKNHEGKQTKTVCECGRTVYLISLKEHLKEKYICKCWK